MTNKNQIAAVMPAEWDARVSTILMAYPNRHTDWLDNLQEARKCYDEIIDTLLNRASMKVMLLGIEHEYSEYFEQHLSKHPLLTKVEDIPYNDTWARDFGPITVERNGTIDYLDFKFNGWGLKFSSNNDNLICRNLRASGLLHENRRFINMQDIVLEGGSIESDGQGTILTTSECLLSPNRNAALTKRQITNMLKKRLGAERVLWLDYGAIPGDDTDSHIDTLARFVDAQTIVYVKSFHSDDSNGKELQAMERQLKRFKTAGGKPYRLFALPQPKPIYDADGTSMVPATYANFLITPRAVLMPVYRQPETDRRALETLTTIFSEREVIPIDCTPLIMQHGSLHCVTMQLI